MARDLQGLIELAYDQSSELSGWLGPLRLEAYDRWIADAGEAAEFLARVIRLSPRKTLDEILRQPDVQAALRVPFRDAGLFTRQQIQRAWGQGTQQGIADASGELADQGIEPPEPPRDIAPRVRNRLLADAERNANAAQRQFREALGAVDPGAAMTRVVRDHALRASLGVDAAGRHAHSAAKEAMYLFAQRLVGGAIRKVWVTSFTPTTCPMCAALHGTRRNLGEAFPADRSFAGALTVYGGHLGHPPRHPNCRCRIVLYLAAFEGRGRTTLDTMREFGRRFWSRLSQR